MIENKHIGKIIVALIGLVVVLCVAAMLFSQQLSDIAGGTAVAM